MTNCGILQLELARNLNFLKIMAWIGIYLLSFFLIDGLRALGVLRIDQERKIDGLAIAFSDKKQSEKQK